MFDCTSISCVSFSALQPQLNVESLLQKLIKAGLINANTDEAKEKSENKEPVQKDLQKNFIIVKDNSEEGKEKRKPVVSESIILRPKNI